MPLATLQSHKYKYNYPTKTIIVMACNNMIIILQFHSCSVLFGRVIIVTHTIIIVLKSVGFQGRYHTCALYN